MKTENTLENKAKFLALYHGQRRVRRDGKLNLNPSEMVQDIDYLELTPLSQITDEDAFGIIKILGVELHSESEIEFIHKSIQNYIDKGYKGIDSYILDYLRSKGYALPWMNLSVDDLTEYGWVKLTS